MNFDSNEKSPCIGCDYVGLSKNEEDAPCRKCSKLAKFQLSISPVQPRVTFSDVGGDTSDMYSINHERARTRKASKQSRRGPQPILARRVREALKERPWLSADELAHACHCSKQVAYRVKGGYGYAEKA